MKIEFGYSNDAIPNGSWQGMGIANGVHIYSGEYLGAYGYGESNYIIAKVDNAKEEYKNKFIVREALCDLYADGSVIMYLNEQQTPITIQMEQFYNSRAQNINSFEDILNMSNGLYTAPMSFKIAEMRGKIIATSIDANIFEEKRNMIKNCHGSISDLQKELLQNQNTR